MRGAPEVARAELARRIGEASRPAFLERYVCPALGREVGAPVRAAEVQVRTVQNDGTGPATLEYRAGGAARVFAKLYLDEAGAHAYEVLCRLWHGGLGGDRPYRVPEPLAFVERCRLLLMRAAPGESLHLRLGVDRAQALAGVREAARWLRALHDSAVRIGRLDQPWYMFAKLADRLSKAAATHPEELARLGAMLSRLERLAERWGEGEVVQVHGQFRPIHVFLDGARVTVIDLDRSVPSTPARDLAEFIHRLRSSLARQPAAAAEAGPLTRAFLDEYTLGRSRALRPLPFYWGFHVLVSLCRHLKRLAPGDAALQPTIDFYASEFDAALALAEAP